MAMARMLHWASCAASALGGFALAVLISRGDAGPSRTDVVTEIAVVEPDSQPQEFAANLAEEPLSLAKMPEDVVDVESVIIAQAVSEVFPSPRLAPSPIPPDHLVPPPQAEPQSDQKSSPVDELIRQEIADVTPEEMDVWRSELKDLPIEAAREILKLRRSIDFAPTDPSNSIDLPTPSVLPPDPLILPEPPRSLSSVNRPRVTESASLIESSLHDLRVAHRVLANNLVNSLTPGFKRLELIWHDSSYQSPSANVYLGSGSSLAETRVDTSPGVIEKSSSSWNLAVEGPGWFRLKHGDEIAVTRNGRLTHHDGTLGVRNGTAFWRLEPIVRLPDSFHEITIQPDGTVLVAEDPRTDKLTTVGTIRLVDVSATALTPLGQSLYAVPQTMSVMSTPAKTESVGVIRQGYCERSNVDFDMEMEALQRLTTHITRLQQAVDAMGDTKGFGELTHTPAAPKPSVSQPASHTRQLPPAIAE